jgi:hypothetical protein
MNLAVTPVFCQLTVNSLSDGIQSFRSARVYDLQLFADRFAY